MEDKTSLEVDEWLEKAQRIQLKRVMRLVGPCGRSLPAKCLALEMLDIRP